MVVQISNAVKKVKNDFMINPFYWLNLSKDLIGYGELMKI